MGGKFQTLAIELQSESDSIPEAVQKFKTSCAICVSRGLNTDCDTCPIRIYHEQTVAVFQDLIEYDKNKSSNVIGFIE